MEVVVVLGGNACQFVSVTLSWNRNIDNFAFLLKATDGTIDRAEAQGVDLLGGNQVHFLDRKWPFSHFDGGTNSLELLGLSLCWHANSIYPGFRAHGN